MTTHKEWDDAKLNLKIAELAFPDRDKDNPLMNWLNMEYDDYLVNMNDLMPLVFEHGIELRKYEDRDYWTAYARGIGRVIKNENPARALCECLYLVLLKKSKENDRENTPN